jgi:hypothetical protein
MAVFPPIWFFSCPVDGLSRRSTPERIAIPPRRRDVARRNIMDGSGHILHRATPFIADDSGAPAS